MTITMGCHQSVPDPNLLYGAELPNIKPYALKTQQARASRRNLIFPSAAAAAAADPTGPAAPTPPPPNGRAARNNWTGDGAAADTAARGASRERSGVQQTEGDVTEAGDHVANGDVAKENGGMFKKQVRIRGDLGTYQEAKWNRERRLRSSHRKREKQAAEMSDKVMEEKERLSFSSSWSRTGSRVTSRAPSPRTHSRNRANMKRYQLSPSSQRHSHSVSSPPLTEDSSTSQPSMPLLPPPQTPTTDHHLHLHHSGPSTSSKASRPPQAPLPSTSSTTGGVRRVQPLPNVVGDLPEVEEMDNYTEITDLTAASYTAGSSQQSSIVGLGAVGAMDAAYFSQKYNIGGDDEEDDDSEEDEERKWKETAKLFEHFDPDEDEDDDDVVGVYKPSFSGGAGRGVVGIANGAYDPAFGSTHGMGYGLHDTSGSSDGSTDTVQDQGALDSPTHTVKVRDAEL